MLSGKDDLKSVFVDEEGSMSEPIPFVYGCVWMAMSTLAFHILNRILITRGPPKVLATTDDVEKWKWRNLMISWIHAILISVWDVSCFYFYPDLTSDLIGYYNVYIYTMVAISAGYFLHDSMDLIFSGMARANWEVLLHHVALVSMLIYNLALCQCIAYSTIALIAEVNTSFLHARKLLQLHKIPFSSPLYQVVCALNLVTFVTCRFLCLGWIGYGIANWADRVPLMYLIGISMSLFVMVIINFILFTRLLSNDVLRQWRPRGGENGRSSSRKNGVKNGKHRAENATNGISASVASDDIIGENEEIGTDVPETRFSDLNAKEEFISDGHAIKRNSSETVRKRTDGNGNGVLTTGVGYTSQNGHHLVSTNDD